jgi:hypothetical protein
VRWPFFAAFSVPGAGLVQLGWVPAVGLQQAEVVHGAGGLGIGGLLPPGAAWSSWGGSQRLACSTPRLYIATALPRGTR